MDYKKYIVLGKLSKEFKGNKPVLVGGSAVELYTLGQSTSLDIDLIVANSKKFKELLKSLGFKNEDRIYYKDDIVIDIVGTFMNERIKVIGIDDEKYKIQVISIEDLIIDRLLACIVWKSIRDCEQAELLYKMYENKLDIDYLHDRAKEEKVYDELLMISRKTGLRKDEYVDKHRIRRK